MYKKLKQIIAVRDKMSSLVYELEKEITSKADFECFIDWQPSDGYVLVHDMKNAPLEGCIGIIKKKRVLTYEDYRKICI